MNSKITNIFAAALCVGGSATAQNISFVHANQVAYSANAPKTAMVVDLNEKTFVIKDAKTDVDVYKGELPKKKFWRESNEDVTWADFSDFKKPGKYYVKVGNDRTPSFSIKEKGAYDETLVWSIKAFYLWRASMAIDGQHATFNGVNYSREAGHPDNVVYLHSSLATPERKADTELSCPGGWYDAGDYGKYTVNAGITLHSLLTAYQLEKQMFDTLNLNIPESTNQTADILDECMYELKWMLTMQDPNDGGVYNKVTTLKFPDMRMPAKDKEDRYVIGKSTDCALDFAATMALASRIYKGNEDYPDFSEKAIKAAKKAYEFAEKKGEIVFMNPSDCNTGEYSAPGQSDEKFWAACEMLITTGEDKYASDITLFQIFNVPFWGDVRTLGLVSLLINKDNLSAKIDKGAVERKYRALIDNLLSLYKFSPGKLPITDFFWGSNGQVANSGALLAIGAKVFNQDKYMEAAYYCYDYLLGENTTGYSFLTGFGRISPKHIHDRRSTSDGIANPLPGYLVGGPNLNQTTDCGKSKYPSNKYSARAYLDDICSYSTNEIALNWNAPFVLLTSLLKGNE